MYYKELSSVQIKQKGRNYLSHAVKLIPMKFVIIVYSKGSAFNLS